MAGALGEGSRSEARALGWDQATQRSPLRLAALYPPKATGPRGASRPTPQAGLEYPRPESPMDITQLILSDHAEQRRLFSILEELEPDDTPSLTAVWGRLAAFLEVHAEAEERFFYPELLRVGQGVASRGSAADETKDAIKDHNKIRAAVSAVAPHAVGSKAWLAAVAAANVANSDHMAEEEREGLTDFRRHASLQLRHTLAVAFAVFEAGHVTGVRPVDKEPRAYIEQHSLRSGSPQTHDPPAAQRASRGSCSPPGAGFVRSAGPDGPGYYPI